MWSRVRRLEVGKPVDCEICILTRPELRRDGLLPLSRSGFQRRDGSIDAMSTRPHHRPETPALRGRAPPRPSGQLRLKLASGDLPARTTTPGVLEPELIELIGAIARAHAFIDHSRSVPRLDPTP